MDRDKARELIEAIHKGVCGLHMNKTVLAKKIARQGYFWLTMEINCVKFIKKCYNCQAYGDVSHLPSIKLQGMTSPWPFAVWGIDVIRKVRSKASNGYCYIMVAINYSKWVESKLYATARSKQMA